MEVFEISLVSRGTYCNDRCLFIPVCACYVHFHLVAKDICYFVQPSYYMLKDNKKLLTIDVLRQNIRAIAF